MPLVRLGEINATVDTVDGWNRYVRGVRRQFKTFCMIPRSAPNTVIKLLLGDLETEIRETERKAKEQNEVRRGTDKR